MAYFKVRIEVRCDWNPAESDLEDIAQSSQLLRGSVDQAVAVRNFLIVSCSFARNQSPIRGRPPGPVLHRVRRRGGGSGLRVRGLWDRWSILTSGEPGKIIKRS
jgi:hypothetical protein